MTARTQLTDGEYVTVEGPLPLDRQLRSFCDEVSWSTLRRAIRTGKVSVDGVTARDHNKLIAKGARVAVHMAAPRDGGVKLAAEAIVFVDSQVIVVDKPALMASVADGKRHKGTLAQILTERFAPKKSSRKVPVGVVSRLDLETSGLIVFTRTPEAHEHLKEQFATRSAQRTYLAIVGGEATNATYESRLVEYADGKRKSTKNRKIGKWSKTHVEVVEKLNGATLVRCILETGRTHQIRIHLSEAGHPILGDKRYARRRIPTPPAPRVMLHAHTLTFEHPTGEQMRFERDMPADMQAVLLSLR